MFLLGPFIFSIANLKKRPAITMCFIQPGLMPFNLSYCYSSLRFDAYYSDKINLS